MPLQSPDQSAFGSFAVWIDLQRLIQIDERRLGRRNRGHHQPGIFHFRSKLRGLPGIQTGFIHSPLGKCGFGFLDELSGLVLIGCHG